MYSEIDVIQLLINKANTASLLDILYAYNLNIDNYNRKISCPFPSHKNGNERSASFVYYPETNSFYCFGCKVGGNATDFIANYENINKYNAALIINEGFITNNSVIVAEKSANHNKIYLEFSHTIREFIHYHNSIKATEYAENICSVFDHLRSKYNLDLNGLDIILIKLKKKLEDYKQI